MRQHGSKGKFSGHWKASQIAVEQITIGFIPKEKEKHDGHLTFSKSTQPPESQTTIGPGSANDTNIQHSLDALENRLYQLSPEPPSTRSTSAPHAKPRPAGYTYIA